MPIDMQAALARKYDILQQQADSAQMEARARAGLIQTQAGLLPEEQAAKNAAARGQAAALLGQANLSNENAKMVGPLAQSQIGLHSAQAGLMGRQGDLLGAQTDVERWKLQPVSEGLLVQIGRRIGHVDDPMTAQSNLTGAPAPAISTGTPAAQPAGGVPPTQMITPAQVGGGGFQPWQPPQQTALSALPKWQGSAAAGQASQSQDDLTHVRGYAAGTSAVGQNGVTPDQSRYDFVHGSNTPTDMYGAVSRFPTQNPDAMAARGFERATRNNGATGAQPGGSTGFAKGTAKVPGKGSGKTDTVPTMLAPGEAVLNKAAADHLGRDTIDLLNAAGAQAMGLDQQPNQPQAVSTAQGKGPTQHFAKGTSNVQHKGKGMPPAKKGADAKGEKPAPKAAPKKDGPSKAPAAAPKGKGGGISPDMISALAGMMGGGGGMGMPGAAPMAAPMPAPMPGPMGRR